MSSLRYLIAAGATLALAAPALAQTIAPPAAPRQESPVRVQTGFNFFVSAPSGDSEEAQKSRDKARRGIYEMAARECDLLRDVLARDCRMESISVNIGRQFGQQQLEGYTVNGSMNFQITPK